MAFRDIRDVQNEAAADSAEDDLDEEKRVLFAALDSFRQYRQAAHANITHARRQAFYSLPSKHVDLLSEPPFCIPDTLRHVDDAIDSNAEIAESILDAAIQIFGYDGDESWKGHARPNDLDKARSTLRQLYRDWSQEGQSERAACMMTMIQALKEWSTTSKILPYATRVLVPGAGLGRLVLELCKEGYHVEGNEISYHQLMASHYILNNVNKGQHTLYPWALSFSNHLTRQNQLQAVAIPDVSPAEELQLPNNNPSAPSGSMSMVAGDFCVVYREAQYEESFDAVLTCFFIDTAPNLINYIETVRHTLKRGGVWINLGPLLWHFESNPTPAEKNGDKLDASFSGIGDPGSFELSNDEVLALLSKYGFEVKSSEVSIPASGYIQDPRSMLQNLYNPAFWIARKI